MKVLSITTFIKCAICGERQAKILCDMPVGRGKNLHIKNDRENSFKEWTITCDKAVCEKCSVEVNPGIHFCKDCLSKIKG